MNTPVTVTESVPAGVFVSNITVNPPNRGGAQTSNAVVVTIGSGFTEVDFTDTTVVMSGSCQPANRSGTGHWYQGNRVPPHGNWLRLSGPTNTGIGVFNIENPSNAGATPIPTADAINSCASNWVTGQTVCTANNTQVYLITGTTVNSQLPDSASGTLSFSGGTMTAGVAMDSVHNRALVGLSTGGGPGFQILNLNTSSPYFGTAFASAHGEISEDTVVDPNLNYLLSASEDGNYESNGQGRAESSQPI